MNNAMDEALLDLTGLKCPLPALYARRHLERAGPGARVLVLTDDPMAPVDIPHMCAGEGFVVERIARDGAKAELTLRRPSPDAPSPHTGVRA